MTPRLQIYQKTGAYGIAILLILAACTQKDKPYESPKGKSYVLELWPDSAYLKSQDFSRDSGTAEKNNGDSARAPVMEIQLNNKKP